MANDQYKIPGSSAESPLNEALRIADSFQYSPEKQPAPYEALKQLEARIDSYIDTALALGGPKKSLWLRAIEPLSLNTKSPVDQLIETTWRLGGEAFAVKDARFGLYKRHENDSPEKRDWYVSYPAQDGSKELISIRYQTTPYSIHKLWAGVEYPFKDDEEARFLKAAAFADNRIRHELSPVDEAIAELLEENDEPVGTKNDYDIAA